MKPEKFNRSSRELPIRIKRGEKWESLNALDPEEVTDAEFTEWFKKFWETKYKTKINTSVTDALDKLDVSTTSAREHCLRIFLGE